MSSKGRVLSFGAALLLFSGSAFAQVSFNWNGKLSGRYDEINRGRNQNRAQDSFVFSYRVDWNGKISLNGVLATGDQYTRRYSTFDDFKTGAFAKPLIHPKVLYLAAPFKVGSMPAAGELGALSNQDRLGEYTAKGSNGWIDGGRVWLETPQGRVAVTAGSLGDFTHPDVGRPLRLNYFEVHVSRDLVQKVLKLETSAEDWDRAIYWRTAVQQSLPDLSHEIVRLTYESLLGGETARVSGSTSAMLHLNALLGHADRREIAVDLKAAYLDPKQGLRNQMMNDFHARGTFLTAGMHGDLTKDHRLQWDASKTIPLDKAALERFNVGIHFLFKGTKSTRKSVR